jgi:pSer/pThr/pTyr-binding forkhead associated (FHA) protein
VAGFEGVMPPMNFKLLVVQGKPAGKSLVFPRGEYYFGRGPECHVRPESEWVSRQHCLLRVTGEAAFIRDLGSRNGTLVNGTLVECERRLFHGDQVQIGPLVFEVRLTPAGTADEAGPQEGKETVDRQAEMTSALDPGHVVADDVHSNEQSGAEATESFPSLPKPLTKALEG